jgi:hypothetical protein
VLKIKLYKLEMKMKKLLALALTGLTAGSFGAIVMDYDFNGTAAGTVVQANMAQYNYTAGTAYVGSNAVANTLAFNGKSSGTDYIIRDKGGAHTNALFVKTVNTSSTDFGIYLQKLDFTDGGANGANITTVNWSFDILGYDSNSNIDPSGWTVKVRTDNTSQNLNVTDAWYGSAATAQTFSFLDDSTGETAANGTWTTISGSYDIAAGTGAAAGGIQISTDNGGYTSGGGIFLDNITVGVTTIPEPATLSLIGAFGAAVIFIRRRFMI